MQTQELPQDVKDTLYELDCQLDKVCDVISKAEETIEKLMKENPCFEADAKRIIEHLGDAWSSVFYAQKINATVY